MLAILIPATYEAKVFVVGGGLMSYGVDFDDAFARGTSSARWWSRSSPQCPPALPTLD